MAKLTCSSVRSPCMTCWCRIVQAVSDNSPSHSQGRPWYKQIKSWSTFFDVEKWLVFGVSFSLLVVWCLVFGFFGVWFFWCLVFWCFVFIVSCLVFGVWCFVFLCFVFIVSCLVFGVWFFCVSFSLLVVWCLVFLCLVLGYSLFYIQSQDVKSSSWNSHSASCW